MFTHGESRKHPDYLMPEREINRQIISKLYLMSFLWRCEEGILNFILSKLPWEGSALSLIPVWISTPSICLTLARTSEQTSASWEKAVRETSKLKLYKLQKVKLQTGGRLLRRGHLAAQGLAGKHIKAASCEISRLKTNKSSKKVGAQQQQQQGITDAQLWSLQPRYSTVNIRK